MQIDHAAIGAGDGGREARVPQNSGKYFSGKYDVEFGHFPPTIMQNSGILLIFHT